MPSRNWKDLSRQKPTAIALGNFDGVHLGHRRLLQALREESESRGLEPLALTFDPHPRHFLSPDQKAPLLTPLEEKESLIRECGVTAITLAFDSELAGVSAEHFVREVLVQRLRGALFFLGPGHRFGKGAGGNAESLRASVGNSSEDPVRETIPVVDETGEIISSSSIRRHLEAGHLDLANRMLGRPYCLRGVVVHGSERGREIGFPTANLGLEDERKALPAFGVYGGAVRYAGRTVAAIGNIGLRPTFSGDARPSVEVHLPGVDENLYGKEMTFELNHYLRPERKFDSIEALRTQIFEDVEFFRKLSLQGTLR